MKKQSAHKAGAALVTGIVTILASIFPEWHGLPPEAVTGLGVLVGTVLVWAIPNKEKAQ